MKKAEVLATIKAASGRPSSLRSLRATLPVAHTRRYASAAAEQEAAAKRRKRVAEIAAGAANDADVAASAAAAAAPIGAFTPQQRETLIDQALLMLQTVYAHLPLKRALHAIDPIQRLQLLRLRHQRLDEREFQSEMIEIFVGLRDLHTNYTLPRLYWSKFAFLPFRVEEYYVAGERRYLVSWVSPVNTDPKLEPGTEISHWNGTPIDLAVARNAAREAGSNAEARRARGLEALTLRWLGASLPPDEDWVTLTFAAGNKTVESRFQWQVLDREDLLPLLRPVDGGSGERATGLGIDVKTELLRRVRKAIFDAPALKADEEMKRHRTSGTVAAPRADISLMPDVYPRFGPVTTPSGTFGYIRLATFVPPDQDVDGAVAEFARLLRAVPSNGLILDVRGNGGGYINFGERLLQMLTPRSITPQPFHFVTTPFTLQIARAESWLDEWKEPLYRARDGL